MKKRIIFVVIILIITLSFIACTDLPSQARVKMETVPTGITKYRVAYFSSNFSEPFSFWIASEMQKVAQQYIKTFTLDVFDSQGNSERQNSLIQTCIAENYDCIIIQPNNVFEQKPYAKKVIDAGIKCIITNAMIKGVNGLYTVDVNSYKQGEILANAAVKAVPFNGKVVLLNYLSVTPNGHQAFMDIIAKQRPDVDIIADQTFDPIDMSQVMDYIENVVKHQGKFDCVLSDSDVLSMSAGLAVKDNPDFKNLLLYGEGGYPGALIDIEAGRYTGTLMLNPVDLAEKNMVAANDLLNGTQKEIHKSIDEVYIDKTNVSDWLQKYITFGDLIIDL